MELEFKQKYRGRWKLLLLLQKSMLSSCNRKIIWVLSKKENILIWFLVDGKPLEYISIIQDN
jgi:hypothetical protein